MDTALCICIWTDDFQLTAIALIRSVSAFFAMVAFLKFGDAFFAVGTSEFRKVARCAFAPFFVFFIATIKVSIATLFRRHAKTVTALDIIFLACTIIWKKHRFFWAFWVVFKLTASSGTAAGKNKLATTCLTASSLRWSRGMAWQYQALKNQFSWLFGFSWNFVRD